MAVGRPPPGKCLQLFILLVNIDSQGQKISEVAFRTDIDMGKAESLLLSQGKCKHQMGAAICCSFSFIGNCKESAPAWFGEWGLQWVKVDQFWCCESCSPIWCIGI